MKTSYRISDWDTHLVEQAKLGVEVAWEMLVDEHRQRLLAYAFRKLRNSEDASDVVQDTFLKAVKGLPSFDSTRPILPWLLRICNNCCIDMIRSRKIKSVPIDDYERGLSEGSANLQDDLEERLTSDAVKEAVRSLPAHYREIIQLRHFMDWEIADIAKKFERPEGTIKSWLFRARLHLRKTLEAAA